MRVLHNEKVKGQCRRGGRIGNKKNSAHFCVWLMCIEFPQGTPKENKVYFPVRLQELLSASLFAWQEGAGQDFLKKLLSATLGLLCMAELWR